MLHQSTRMDAYGAALDRLRDMDLLYPCFCTGTEIRAEIARAARAPQGPEGPIYPGTCRSLSADARETLVAECRPYAVRLHMARDAAGARLAKRDDALSLRALRQAGKSLAEARALAGFAD